MFGFWEKDKEWKETQKSDYDKWHRVKNLTPFQMISKFGYKLEPDRLQEESFSQLQPLGPTLSKLHLDNFAGIVAT